MKRLAVAVAVLAAVAIIGTFLVRPAESSSSGSGGSAAESKPATTASPTPAQAGRPDPVATAVDVVALTDEVVRAGFISRRDLVESFATAGFGPTLAAETSEQVTALLQELGSRGLNPAALEVIELPLAARLLDEGADTAEVEVWSVMVVAAPGTGPARQVWRTVSVRMLLVGDQWLVDGWQSALGPTPAFAPEVPIASAEEIIEILSWPSAEAGRS